MLSVAPVCIWSRRRINLQLLISAVLGIMCISDWNWPVIFHEDDAESR